MLIIFHGWYITFMLVNDQTLNEALVCKCIQASEVTSAIKYLTNKVFDPIKEIGKVGIIDIKCIWCFFPGDYEAEVAGSVELAHSIKYILPTTNKNKSCCHIYLRWKLKKICLTNPKI